MECFRLQLRWSNQKWSPFNVSTCYLSIKKSQEDHVNWKGKLLFCDFPDQWKLACLSQKEKYVVTNLPKYILQINRVDSVLLRAFGHYITIRPGFLSSVFIPFLNEIFSSIVKKSSEVCQNQSQLMHFAIGLLVYFLEIFVQVWLNKKKPRR